MEMDPLNIRMKNIRKPGYIEEETGIEVFSNGLEECLKKGRDLIGWDSKEKIYAKRILVISAAALAWASWGCLCHCPL